MKVTNVSSLKLYLHDLRVTKESQTEGRPGEDRYLAPGSSVYLPNTSEVVRSAFKGDLRRWKDDGVVTLEDEVTVDANGSPGDSAVLTHGFGLPPSTYVLKQVGPNWVDATGTVNISHNSGFTVTTVQNTLLVPQTLFIRLVLHGERSERRLRVRLCSGSRT